MKPLILTLSLAILGACSAYKGSLTGAKGVNSTDRHVASDSDFYQIVADLRQSFMNGRIPTIKDIPLGQEIGCYVHSYQRKYYGDGGTTISYVPNLFNLYRAKGKYIYNKGASHYFPVRIAYFTGEGIRSKFESLLLAADGPTQKRTVTIRLEKGANAIIAERTFWKNSKSNRYLGRNWEALPESVVDEDYKVLNYMHCPL